MQEIKNITLGSDPEVFLAEESGRVVSAIPYIPGDKYSPFQIPDLSEGHCIQTDNIMIEYCLPPATTATQMYESFLKCVDWTKGVLPAGLSPKIQAYAIVEDEFLDHPNAKRFGCERDFNAWQNAKVNSAPKSTLTSRTCGGHIHVGYSEPDYENQLALIQAMDIFLGIPSIILDPDKERKKMYGKAGAFRFKHYGVEYRVLSNFWLASKELVETIFEGVNRAVQFVNEDRVNKLTDEEQLEIQICINTGDELLAYKLINKYNLQSLIQKTVTID